MITADDERPDGETTDLSKESSSGSATVHTVRRSPYLAGCGVVAGLLTVVVGLAVFGMGMAFANATACGTGAAGVFVGLWTVMAVRGVARRRLRTLAGLSLAWTWFIGRVLVDSPATVTSAVVLGSLTAAISLPLGFAWLLLVVGDGSAGLLRTIGAYRRWRREPVQDESGGASRTVRGLGIRLGLLVAITLLTPQGVWWMRGREIAELARRYALPHGAARRPVDFGACGVLFLGYESTRESAKAGKTEAQRLAIYDRTLADALADLEAIVAAGARYVRVGASGDHLLARISHESRRVHMQGARCEGVLGHIECRATQQMRPTGLARRASASATLCHEKPRTQSPQLLPQTASVGQSAHVISCAGEKCGLDGRRSERLACAFP